LVAGGAAGAVSRTCTAPLDRLKCMLMVYGTRKNNARFNSFVRNMMQEGGVRSFWRGNAINVAKIMPEMALKFMIYEQIKRILKSDNRELGIADRFVAGSLAGATAQSIIYPLEVLKTRLVLRTTGQYNGVVDCAVNLWKREKIRGFYRGFIPNLLGILQYAGIDLAVYETLKKMYINDKSGNEVKPGAMILLVCGIISSSCGQLACYPLSLVRTRLQANISVDSSATMTGTFRTIITSDGLAGLYRGLGVNFLKVAPAVGLSYLVYETTQDMLGVTMT
jgi:solute carrier family 25 phosphate transporter 23/24/25/41